MEGSRGGPGNMARDHALAATLAPDRGILRLYRWRPPTVSFGRNEPARGLYDRDAAAARGVAFVRRPTGGRTVLHDRELTYAVVVPLRSLGGPRAAYRRVNAGLVRALAALGVEAELARGEGPGPALDGGSCFRAAAPGEVTVAGRKLVGSAQARLGAALLQHGSLLLEGRQELLGELAPAARADGPPPVSLSELLGRLPARGVIVEALVEGLRAELGGRWCDTAGPGPTEAGLERTLEERYRSEAWTWRR